MTMITLDDSLRTLSVFVYLHLLFGHQFLALLASDWLKFTIHFMLLQQQKKKQSSKHQYLVTALLTSDLYKLR